MNNITADATDYLYKCIIPVSSELDRFQKDLNIPKGKDKQIPERTQPSHKKRISQTNPKTGTKGGSMK